ncbi:hypothetical protein CF327_g3099 [Tilletia walkeri]|nr:hypothetical protein CF327_g3099 [Tilletia walkeri]
MSTSSQALTSAGASAAAPIDAQQVQGLSPDPLLSSVPSTAVATSPVSSFLTLPTELIKAILERCDDSTLLKLRQVCRTAKAMIDEDATLDQSPFRYRPSADLPLTEDEIDDIRRCERFWKEDEALFGEPDFYHFISVNPALKRLHWSSEDGWTEARLGSRLRAGDDPECAYNSVKWSAEGGLDFSFKLISRFKVEDVPWVLDELAMRPPVSSLKITIEFVGIHKPPVSMVIGRKGHGEERCSTTSSTEVGADVQEDVPQPVLVKDVIGALADLARRCELLFPRDNPYRGDQDERIPLLLKYPPSIQATSENVFGLVFDHADTSGLPSLQGLSNLFENVNVVDFINSLMMKNP